MCKALVYFPRFSEILTPLCVYDFIMEKILFSSKQKLLGKILEMFVTMQLTAECNNTQFYLKYIE